jgi:Flp pilus assembly protein TadG
MVLGDNVFRNRHESHLERGAAAVEMALVLPLLLLVLFGLVDFGRAFNAQMQLTQAAREGVRVVVLGGTLSDAQTRAQLAMPAGGGTTSPTVLTTASTLCTSGVDGLGQVTVTSTFTFITPLGPIARVIGASTLPGAGDTKTLSATGVMRCSG